MALFSLKDFGQDTTIGANTTSISELNAQINDATAASGKVLTANGAGDAAYIDPVVNSVAVSISSETFTATAAQTEFNLTNTSGVIFQVVVANVPQTLTVGYNLDAEKNTATLTSGATEGDKVTLYYAVGTAGSSSSSEENFYKTDFINSTTIPPWTSNTANTGTINANALSVEVNHPGHLVLVSHASNPNSGAYLKTYNNGTILKGGEKSTFIFKTLALTGVTGFLGWQDTSDHTEPVNGVYLKISGTTLSGNGATNSTRTATGTTYTLGANTWYRAIIEINADATSATFTLYTDDSDTVLWTSTVAANIPKAASRVVGHGATVTLGSPSGATNIIILDYMDLTVKGRKLA